MDDAIDLVTISMLHAHALRVLMHEIGEELQLLRAALRQEWREHPELAPTCEQLEAEEAERWDASRSASPRWRADLPRGAHPDELLSVVSDWLISAARCMAAHDEASVARISP